VAAARPTDARLLTFRVGDQNYGVPAAQVREVARLPKLTSVPHGPHGLLGVANFRGEVLPVLSATLLLGGTGGAEERAILVEGQSPVALAVEQVETIADRADGTRLLDIDTLLSASFGAPVARRARYAAAKADQPTERRDAIGLVAFAIGDQEFAFPLASVERIVPVPAAIALHPEADPVVIGTIGFENALLPLLSLRALLGLPGAEADARARVVIVRIGSHRVGLIVDRMHAVIRLAASEIDPVPMALARGSAEARIQAICRLDAGRRPVSILSAEHLLREDITMRLLESAEDQGAMIAPEAAEAQHQFLLFRIGDGEFGLPIAYVDEVALLPPKLTRIPKAPAFVKGVMNLRGRVVPVIDQTLRFQGQSGEGRRRRVIVVRTGDLVAGFLVDAVSEIVRVPESAIRPAPDLGGEETRVFDRVATLDGEQRVVLIIAPRELLDRAERELLEKLRAKAPARSS
jgi:purine-binding chemotaxis protein CheW